MKFYKAYSCPALKVVLIGKNHSLKTVLPRWQPEHNSNNDSSTNNKRNTDPATVFSLYLNGSPIRVSMPMGVSTSLRI